MASLQRLAELVRGLVDEVIDQNGNVAPAAAQRGQMHVVSAMETTDSSHIGPGIPDVLSGKLTFTEAGKATIYQAGDYFFESGNFVHTAQNKTRAPLRVLFIEILPADWTGPTVIPPKL